MVVVVASDSDIYIGGDSKIVFQYSALNRPTIVCKIHDFHKFVVAGVGTMNVGDRIDVSNIIRTVCNPKKSLDSNIQQVMSILKTKLDSCIVGIRTQPEFIQQSFFSNFEPIAIVFAHCENGQSMWVNLFIGLNRRENGGYFVSAKTTRMSGIRGRNVLIPYGVGMQDSIYSFWQTHTDSLNTLLPEQRVLTILKLSLRLYPDYIGEPFSMIKIDRHGTHWIMQSQECKE